MSSTPRELVDCAAELLKQALGEPQYRAVAVARTTAHFMLPMRFTMPFPRQDRWAPREDAISS
ncbi:hypothetical protein [Caballeronia sordidicola]|uniref:Uncharacterized protein n=1 Tax=Caballeronia sordidicola TaxID=196367 RepID=A0A226WP30_CABSO|nr:hypothetical protein [Caballeronia sordidicola]OXC72579.1 hypothetical protein BSU04_41435 [Caballeronia sordidicola]